MKYLEQYLKQAQNAHYWISYGPEKAGEIMIRSFEKSLQSDLQEIGSATDEQKNNYIEMFKHHFENWIKAKSRCISPMIYTGKFPVKKAEKADRGEKKHFEIFDHFRSKEKKRILKNVAKQP